MMSAGSWMMQVSARGHFSTSPGSVGLAIAVEVLVVVGGGESAEVVTVVELGGAVVHGPVVCW